MAAASTPFNMTVIRSQGAHHPLYALMAKLTVGDDYACPGYDSASINKNNTWGGGNVKVIYRVPKGTKAIFMKSLNESARPPATTAVARRSTSVCSRGTRAGRW